MKTRFFSLLTAILCVLIIASFAAADAGLYPIGQQQTQSYPIPQYNKPQPQPQPRPPQENRMMRMIMIQRPLLFPHITLIFLSPHAG